MSNNEADVKNKNLGTIGTNKTLDKNHGNRSKQLIEQAKKVAQVKKK